MPTDHVRLECQHLAGRLREICEGTVLTLEKCNAYRVSWGMQPLSEMSCTERSEVTPEMPTIVTTQALLFNRVVTFATAMTNHVRDGMTKCDEAEIQSRLEICQQCPSFTGTHCRECGCACSQKKTFFNKLAWRSERCPLGRW